MCVCVCVSNVVYRKLCAMPEVSCSHVRLTDLCAQIVFEVLSAELYTHIHAAQNCTHVHAALHADVSRVAGFAQNTMITCCLSSYLHEENTL